MNEDGEKMSRGERIARARKSGLVAMTSFVAWSALAILWGPLQLSFIGLPIGILLGLIVAAFFYHLILLLMDGILLLFSRRGP